MKSSLGKRVIDRLVDPGVRAAQVKSSDPDFSGRRLSGNRSLITCREPVLQKIHSLHHVSHVFPHRPDGIQMLRLNREDTLGGNEAKSRLQTNHAAASRGDADRTRGIRSKGDVGATIRDRHR